MNNDSIKQIVFLIIISITSISIYSQKNILKSGKNFVQQSKAENYIYENKYRDALLEYRKIYIKDSTNKEVIFGISKCHYYLNDNILSKYYIDKLNDDYYKYNNELFYIKALNFHSLYEFDSALIYYNKFSDVISKRDRIFYEIDKMIKQVDFAKMSIDNPKNVKVTNLGKNINNHAPEYSASISADGMKIVFTSRREDTKGGHVDNDYDGLYYEDIYESFFDYDSNNWSLSTNIQGAVNTEYHDAVLNISPNGNLIFLYKNIEGETKSGDIYFSRISSDGKWGFPKNANENFGAINSTYFESSATITEDGNQVYFISDRPKGVGMSDIWEIHKENNNWTKPKNLGNIINTKGNEKWVFIHPEGNTIFFSSDSHIDNMGKFDIYYSKKTDGIWSKPINMGYPINTVADEKSFSITKDYKKAIISSMHKENYGNSDLYDIEFIEYEF